MKIYKFDNFPVPEMSILSSHLGYTICELWLIIQIVKLENAVLYSIFKYMTFKTS